MPVADADFHKWGLQNVSLKRMTIGARQHYIWNSAFKTFTSFSRYNSPVRRRVVAVGWKRLQGVQALVAPRLKSRQTDQVGGAVVGILHSRQTI